MSSLHHLGAGSHANLLARQRFSLAAPGELFLWPPWRPLDLARHAANVLWRERSAYRFALTLARDALRARRIRRAARVVWTVFVRQNRWLLGDGHSSFWALDSDLQLRPDGLDIECSMARPDGSLAAPVTVRKQYRLRPDRVDATLSVSGVPRGWRLLFIAPATASGVTVGGASVNRCRAGRMRLTATEEVVQIRFAVETTSGS